MEYERQRLTDRQWRQVFQRQRRSGLSIGAFCEREGVAKSTFFAKRRDLEAKEETQAAEPRPSAFVEVTPRGDSADAELRSEPMVAEARDGEPIEVVLRDGVAVRVRSGFDASLLRRVVEVLR